MYPVFFGHPHRSGSASMHFESQEKRKRVLNGDEFAKRTWIDGASEAYIGLHRQHASALSTRPGQQGKCRTQGSQVVDELPTEFVHSSHSNLSIQWEHRQQRLACHHEARDKHFNFFLKFHQISGPFRWKIKVRCRESRSSALIRRDT